ncbi:A kinase (PRKA) anchor protein 1b [Aplochiton taeniatus]
MPLRFRSFLPYTLPGVLALIGWWWYAQRKKQPLTSPEGEGAVPASAMGLLTSPAEGSNGLGPQTNDTASLRPINRDRAPEVKEQRSTEQEVVALVHIPASPCATPIDFQGPLTSSTPRPDRERVQSESHTASELKPLTYGLTPEVQHRLQEERLSSNSGALSEEAAIVVTSLTLSTPSADTKLDKAERPEPEGEVAVAETTAPTHREPEMHQLPNTPISSQPSFHHVLNSTSGSSAAESEASDRPTLVLSPGPVHQQQDGGEACREALEMERLAAGLITEVISAATQEVLSVSQLANGGPCAQQELITQDPAPHQHHLLQGGPSPIGQELRGVRSTAQEEEGIPNGCPVSSRVWKPLQDGDREGNHWPDQLRAEEGTAQAEDSACSTCHSEDGISNEEFQSSTLHSHRVENIQALSQGEPAESRPEEEGVVQAAELGLPGEQQSVVKAVCDMRRLNGLGQRNGAHLASETETDQSGGSDVNSMDSVDSGCTMGAGDIQSAGDHATALGSELIVWEIEVPKHLVGRLIGKQGRYVSFLKQSSGAKIYISTLPYTQEFQICHIEGSQQQVDKALSLIGKKFKDLDLTNLYAPAALPLSLPSLPMTSWLLLPSGVTVEVIVVNIVSAGHIFVQQHTHPTYHALRSLDQQMFLCYSQPGTPALPSPAEVGVICAAPAVEGAWYRAQVISFYKDTSEVEIRYVDYGGYDRVKIDTLRQIRSDFVTLPFQGAEVLLDNIAPIPGEDRFSTEANSALEEMTRGVALLAQVTNYDNNTGLPLVQMWNMVGDELVLMNRTLAERGLATWVDSF